MPAEGIDLERLAKIPVATLTQVMQGIGLPVWARGFHGGPDIARSTPRTLTTPFAAVV